MLTNKRQILHMLVCYKQVKVRFRRFNGIFRYGLSCFMRKRRNIPDFRGSTVSSTATRRGTRTKRGRGLSTQQTIFPRKNTRRYRRRLRERRRKSYTFTWMVVRRTYSERFEFGTSVLFTTHNNQVNCNFHIRCSNSISTHC